MEPIDPTASPQLSLSRAFLPFRIAVGLSVFLLCLAFDARHAESTRVFARVSVGGLGVRDFRVSVDGGSFRDSDDPVPIGWHDIGIKAVDGIPEYRPCFIWYGSNSLGRVPLEVARGKVRIDVHPQPARYTLTGATDGYVTPTGFFSNIPVGDYIAGFEYGRGLSHAIRVQVVADSPSSHSVTNPVGRIEILGESPIATVAVESRFDGTKFKGRLPFVVPFVRSGEYSIRVERPNYLVERIIDLQPGATNSMLIEFVYGGLEITSDPSGASVVFREGTKGVTPLRLEHLVPGSYSFEIVKEGFQSEKVTAEVTGTNVAAVHRVLENAAYRKSMVEYRWAQVRGRHREALEALQSALRVKPEDKEALELLPKLKSAAYREEAGEWVSRRDSTKASEALDRAEAALPDEPETREMRVHVASLKSELDRENADASNRRLEEEKRNAIDAGRRAREAAENAISSERFDRAREAIAEVRRWNLNDPILPELEVKLMGAESAFETRVAKEKLEEQVRVRRREIEDALRLSSRTDEHQPIATVIWRTSKSPRQVEYACEPKEGKGMKVYDLLLHKDYLMTWRNGSLVPLIGIGTFVRFAAVSLAPDQTEIHARIYSIGFADGKPAPDRNQVRNRAVVKSVFESLSKALDGDLQSQ